MSKTTNLSQSVVLVGGKDAGKTNYLGRLWMALDAETGIVKKNGLPLEIEYLRGVASSLNSGEFAGRSAPGLFKSTTMPVRCGDSASIGELVVPDCAGEQWEKIHVDREWNAEWEKAVASMAGCIVFFRCTSEHNVEALDWSNHAELMEYLNEVNGSESDPPNLPTQVILADSLQCLTTAYREIQGTDRPLRVSVVLSAWDLAPKEFRDADPDDYLSQHLPLLHDFLWGNPLLFSPKTFGVSVAGGVLTKEDTPFMTNYLNSDPAQSGYVVFANANKMCRSADVTLPLAWAFGCSCPQFPSLGVDRP